jgi:cytochrome c oxidase cbb3-type subunit 4
MDINDIRGIGTIFALIAFIGIVAWAYSSRHKDRFEDDGMIPFMDDDDALLDKQPDKSVERKNTNDDKGSE